MLLSQKMSVDGDALAMKIANIMSGNFLPPLPAKAKRKDKSKVIVMIKNVFKSLRNVSFQSIRRIESPLPYRTWAYRILKAKTMP